MGDEETTVMPANASSDSKHRRVRNSSQVKYEKEEANTHATAFLVLLFIIATILVGEFYIYPRIMESYASKNARPSGAQTPATPELDLTSVASIEKLPAPEATEDQQPQQEKDSEAMNPGLSIEESFEKFEIRLNP